MAETRLRPILGTNMCGHIRRCTKVSARLQNPTSSNDLIYIDLNRSRPAIIRQRPWPDYRRPAVGPNVTKFRRPKRIIRVRTSSLLVENTLDTGHAA